MDRLLFLIALLALLTACGGAPAAVPTASAPTSAPTKTAAMTPTSAPTAAPTTGRETRTVTHALGTTEVPANPQRVASLNPITTDHLVALGVPLAAIATYNGSDFTSYEYMADMLADVPIIGTFTEPNQELLVQIKPDLIIGRDQELEQTYATISQIAPTVAIADQSDVRTWLRQVAVVVGRDEQAERLISDYETRAAAARAAIAEAVGNASAVFLRVQPDEIRVYNDQRLGGPILYNDLGLRQPAFVAAIPDDTTFASISLEQISQLADADHIFLLDQSREGEAAPVFASPLWQQLPAVQAGRVYPAARDIWINLGIIAATRVVESVEQALTGGGAASASFPLTITHARGETTLERPAERVVALEWTYVENLLALGVQPVGVADISGYNDWVQIPVALDAGVQDVGTRQAPDLERIAALKPDLILAPSFRVDANYDALNAIAPTLAFDPYPANTSLTQYDEMVQTFQTIARVVGREQEGARVLAAMEQTFSTQAERIKAAGQAGAPFVLAQAFSGGNGAQVRLFTENALAVQIVERLGLENAWQDTTFQQYGFSTVSVEALPQLGEAHFFYVVQDDDNVFATDMIRPLWESLPFVRAGNAHPLGGDTWLFGGPLSAEVLSEKVTAALVP